MSTADIRYYDPEVHSMVHVTDVTVMNSFLFRPSHEFNRIYLGVFGWAQRETQIKAIAIQVMSSHHHLILQPEDHGQLSEFMCLMKTNLAKEVKRLYHDWEYRSVFDGGFHAIPVSHDVVRGLRPRTCRVSRRVGQIAGRRPDSCFPTWDLPTQPTIRNLYRRNPRSPRPAGLRPCPGM